MQRRCRRVARSAGAVASLGAIGVMLLGTLAPAGVAAQDAGEPPGFVPGEATALASTITLGLSPGGGKPIDIVLGKSTARYQNRTATSEGSALALGLLQIFFGPSSQCGDRPPIIPADQLPPVSTNDSRRNAPMTAAVDVHSPGWSGTATTPGTPGGVVGTQIANAAAAPQSSTAATTTVSQDYGVVALDGGHTEVSTSLVGGVRTATAVMAASRLRVMGDMVVVNNPRWEATTTSGATQTAAGSFTFSSATILGIDRTAANFPGDFADFANGIAGFLGGLGVHLEYPRLVVDSGTVTMTPLVVGLANPPIGIDFIQPLLRQLAPLKEENTRNLIAEDCNNQAILQVADLALGIFSGSGALRLSVGGVSAFTAATVFPEPPSLDLLLDAPDAPPISAVDVPSAAAPQVLGNNLSSPRISVAPAASLDDTPLAAVEPAVAPLPTAEVDAAPAAAPVAAAAPAFDLPDATLVSRRFEPGSRGGSAAVVGAAGLVGLVVLALADRFVMRRNKRELAD